VSASPLAAPDGTSSPVVSGPVRAWVVDLGARVLPALGGGALAGLLVGGVGGRIAMLVLRLTSPDGVRGRESDDGFTIGRFSTATVFLLLVAAAAGALAGLLYVVVRPLLPPRLAPVAFAALGGLVGGAAILHADGVDFRVLRPLELAVLLFVAVPGVGAWCVARLVDRWTARWPVWPMRRRVASLIPAVPWAAIVAIALPSLLAVAVFDALRSSRIAFVHRAVVVMARGALVLVAVLGGLALVRDVRGILS
jgi:hypothetical protein